MSKFYRIGGKIDKCYKRNKSPKFLYIKNAKILIEQVFFIVDFFD